MARRATNAKNSESKEKLLAVAYKLMTKHGYSATSISMVCAEAGVPPTSIYWHFKNKEDLFLEVIKHGVEKYFTAVNQIHLEGAGAPDGDYRANIKKITRILIKDHEFICFIMLAMLEEANLPPSSKKVIQELRQRSLEWWERVIASVFISLGEEEAGKLAKEYAPYCRHMLNGAVAAQNFGEPHSIRDTMSAMLKFLEAVKETKTKAMLAN